LKARTAHVVNRRAHRSQRGVGGRIRHRQVGVALHAQLAHRGTGQHPRIRRAVRLVACGAAFQADGSMLEGEGAAFVTVAFEATRLIGVHCLDGARQQSAMRIVAIHAGHRAFGKTMFVWALETGPDVSVAVRAQRIDVWDLAGDQSIGTVFVHRVAGYAAHLVLGMAAIDAPDVGWLVQMAGEANLVRFGGFEFRRLAYVGGGHGLRMLATGAVTGFASIVLKAALLVLFDYLMGVFLESVEDVFVASLTGGRADELGGLVFRRRLRGRLGGGARLGGVLRRSAPRVDGEQHGCHASN